jgi:hypothetical protein
MKKIVKKVFFKIMEYRIICYYRLKIKRYLSTRTDKIEVVAMDKKAIKNTWSPLSKLPSTKWHNAFATANRFFSPLYCPEDLFYAYIEPALNEMRMVDAYVDKNGYDRLFPDVNMPRTVLRCMRNRLYDSKYQMLDEDRIEILPGDYIIKPSLDSGGGKNVAKLKADEENIFSMKGKSYTLKELKAYFRGDFIVQELISQSDILSKINPSSINTIRITTMRHNDNIVHLSSILRFSSNDAITDNENLGGSSVGLDPILESMKKYAYDKYGNKIELHPKTKFVFEDQRLHGYKEIAECAKKIHEQLSYFDMVSFDFAIDTKNQPIFIEINLKNQGITFHQYNNGPLFVEYTHDVIRDTVKARSRRWL